MLYSYPTLSVSHLRAMRDILAQKVFGILPVEETKGDKSFTVYADGSYKAEMPINYKISLAKRPVLLLEKDIQAR